MNKKKSKWIVDTNDSAELSTFTHQYRAQWTHDPNGNRFFSGVLDKPFQKPFLQMNSVRMEDIILSSSSGGVCRPKSDFALFYEYVSKNTGKKYVEWNGEVFKFQTFLEEGLAGTHVFTMEELKKQLA